MLIIVNPTSAAREPIASICAVSGIILRICAVSGIILRFAPVKNAAENDAASDNNKIVNLNHCGQQLLFQINEKFVLFVLSDLFPNGISTDECDLFDVVVL